MYLSSSLSFNFVIYGSLDMSKAEQWNRRCDRTADPHINTRNRVVANNFHKSQSNRLVNIVLKCRVATVDSVPISPIY